VVDSPVEGLSYASATLNGTTDADGIFSYETNETVTFSIGDITLGSTSGAAVITPVDMVSGATSETDPVVTNIARFLQTLDDDGNPDNGIIISNTVSNLAAGKNIDFMLSTSDFENNGNVQTVIADLTASTSAGARTLVTGLRCCPGITVAASLVVIPALFPSPLTTMAQSPEQDREVMKPSLFQEPSAAMVPQQRVMRQQAQALS